MRNMLHEKGVFETNHNSVDTSFEEINKHVFKVPVSVHDLAQMIADINMDQMPPGSKLHFTQKTNGGVGMSICEAHNSTTGFTEHRLLEAADGAEWPFIPEIVPAALLQSLLQTPTLVPGTLGFPARDRWGLREKRISSLCMRTPHDSDPPCVKAAARYVLNCLKNADCF